MASNLVRKLKDAMNCVKYVFKMSVSYGDIVVHSQPDLLIQRSSVSSRIEGTSDASSDSPSQISFNGVIGSMEFFILVITFAACVLIAPFLSPKAASGNCATQVVLIGFMLAGFVVMVCFIRFQSKLLRRGAGSISLKGRLTIAGLILFYIFSCILDFLYAIDLIKCLYAFQLCGGRPLFSHVTSIVFHISRVVYLGTETVVCIVFRSAKFLNKSSTRYGLMILQASNLALWFDILLRESEEKQQNPFSQFIKINQTINNSCLVIVQNMTQSDFDCLHGNTTLQNTMAGSISPYLYPFPYEFSILVGEYMMKWFIQCSSSHEGRNTSIQIEPEEELEDDVASVSTDGRGMETLVRRRAYLDRERCSTVASSVDSSLPSVEVDRPISHSMIPVLCLLFGIILNIVFGILSFIAEDNNKQIYLYFSLFYWVFLIFVNGLGYYCSSAFLTSNTKKKFKNLDYLYLVTMVGPITYAFTAFFIIFREGSDPGFGVKYGLGPVVYFFLEFSYSLSVFTQIPLSFLAGRVTIPNPVPTGKQRIKIAMFKMIVLHLAISNGTCWFLRTFSSSETTGDIYIQHFYFDQYTWNLLYIFILPLVLFFRFNSCILYTCAYIRMANIFSRAQH